MGPRSTNEIVAFAVEAIRAGAQDAAAHYKEYAAVTMRAAFSVTWPIEAYREHVQRRIEDGLQGKGPKP